MENVETYLKSIADQSRLKILYCLGRDTYCVCELVDYLKMSQPAVSQHLKRLRNAGIVMEEKRGKWVYYSLDKNHEWYPLILHVIQLMPPMEPVKRLTCS